MDPSLLADSVEKLGAIAIFILLHTSIVLFYTLKLVALLLKEKEKE